MTLPPAELRGLRNDWKSLNDWLTCREVLTILLTAVAEVC